jgi:hypothetical protein
MYLAHAMNLLGIEENALCGGCLTGINVSDDTNISRFFE